MSGSTPGIDLAPADRFGRRCAGQAAPDDLVGRDLDEVVVAALGNAVDLPQRRLALQVEVLRRAAAEDHAPVLLAGQDDGADLVDVLVGVDHQRAAVHELVVGDVHADRAVAGRRRVDRARRPARRAPRPSTPRTRDGDRADPVRAGSGTPRSTPDLTSRSGRGNRGCRRRSRAAPWPETARRRSG